MLARYFIERPVLANVIALLAIVIGVGGAALSSRRAVSADHAADRPGHGALSRRERADGRRHRGAADRAAGQRRRKNALHAVDVGERRHLCADRDVRGRHRSRPGAGAGPESNLGDDGVAAGCGAGARRRDQEEEHGDPADHHAHVARQIARQPVPEQLRHHQPEGHDRAHSRRRRRAGVRDRPVQHARLARSRADEGARADADRRHQCDQAAEPGGRGRADRRASGPGTIRRSSSRSTCAGGSPPWRSSSRSRSRPRATPAAR